MTCIELSADEFEIAEFCGCFAVEVPLEHTPNPSAPYSDASGVAVLCPLGKTGNLVEVNSSGRKEQIKASVTGSEIYKDEDGWHWRVRLRQYVDERTTPGMLFSIVADILKTSTNELMSRDRRWITHRKRLLAVAALQRAGHDRRMVAALLSRDYSTVLLADRTWRHEASTNNAFKSDLESLFKKLDAKAYKI